jgi:two-component system LytT family response regulator
VVDDVAESRKTLIRDIKDYCPEIIILGEADGVVSAARLIRQLKPELIFLDIQMQDGSGFDLLDIIGEENIKVIFTTASDAFALKAFEVNALDYLLKPIDLSRLSDSIQKLEKQVQAQTRATESPSHKLGAQDQIFVKDGEKCWFVRLDRVRLCESMGNYVRLFFDDQKPLVLKSLNAMEDRLDPKVFFRANRKHIINLNYIDKIEPWFSGGLQVTLMGKGEKIEISRRQSIRFKELLSL